jgi:hypothetical protein
MFMIERCTNILKIFMEIMLPLPPRLLTVQSCASPPHHQTAAYCKSHIFQVLTSAICIGIPLAQQSERKNGQDRLYWLSRGGPFRCHGSATKRMYSMSLAFDVVCETIVTRVFDEGCTAGMPREE